MLTEEEELQVAKLAERHCKYKNTYVLENEIGLVKVGVSQDPYNRAKDIEGASGFKTEVKFVLENYDVEQDAHAILASYRKCGEWFSCTVGVAEKVLCDLAKEDYKVRLQLLRRTTEALKYNTATVAIVKSDLIMLHEIALDSIIEHAGSTAHLAVMLGIPKPTVQGWYNNKRVSKKGAMLIESHPTLGSIFPASRMRPEMETTPKSGGKC